MVDDAGVPAKPWHISTNDHFVYEELKRPCPGKAAHPHHSIVQGKHAKLTEGNTDSMAQKIHLAWKLSCQMAAGPKAEGVSAPAPEDGPTRTSHCPPMVVQHSFHCCLRKEVCVAAARASVAGAEEEEVDSIVAVAMG